MKKYIFCSMVAVALALTGCEPIEDRNSNDSTVLTAEQLKSMCSVTVKQENGKNVNYVYCDASAPCNITWTNGAVSSTKPTTELLMLVTGEQVVTARGLCADGTIVEAEFPVTIEEISPNHPVSPYWGYLCGTGEKTWGWDDFIDGKSWGEYCYSYLPELGVPGAVGAWWGTNAAGVFEAADAGEATMTFSLDGATITKSSGATGNFSFDDTNTTNLGDFDLDPSMGRLSATGAGILYPYSAGGAKATDFDIAYIDENQLVLARPEATAADGADPWDSGTFWCFKAK